jgi:hypothetical protein
MNIEFKVHKPNGVLSSCAADPGDDSRHGILQHEDCNHAVNNNSGCSFLDPSPLSYGADFAKAGGGLWVTMFLETEISQVFRDSPGTILSADLSRMWC